MTPQDVQNLFDQNPGKLKKELAEKLRIRESAVTSILKGTRRIQAEERRLIQEFFGIDRLPIRGKLIEGGILKFAGPSEPPERRVSTPKDWGEETTAIEISTDALGPHLRGWTMFFEDTDPHQGPVALGALYVVALPDDRVIVRQVQASRLKRKYHLTLQGEEPILDTPVKRIGLVTSFARPE